MDDLSMKVTKLVIGYCLEIAAEIQEKISGKPTLVRLENALGAQYAEQYENKVYQYRWTLRHPVVNEAVANALHNRFRALV
jgi:hypothetical protein